MLIAAWMVVACLPAQTAFDSVSVKPSRSVVVARTATEAEMKSAYRKLAMQLHPDRNPGDKESEHKFKEVNEAYDVLKDGQKRAAYDRFGHAAFEQGGVTGDQIAGDPRRGAKKHSQKRPSLPEPKIAGRPEDERAHDERKRAEPKPSLQVRGHRCAPRPSVVAAGFERRPQASILRTTRKRALPLIIRS